MQKPVLRVLFTSALLLVCGFLMGMKPADKDYWDHWLNDFSGDDDETRALAVNEGELEFLKKAPAKTPHLLQNKFIISHQSLKDGWVQMVQCHEHLDQVALAQVLYHKHRTRNLKVLSNEGIGRAWVEKNSVQLENIGQNASLCVQAEVHALYPNFNGSYSMHNGPFLRKFLDGYYPMRVTMDVTFPEGKLSFEAINPQAQNGFDVRYEENKMNIKALFVGELEIEIYFTDLTGAGEGS